MDAHYHSSQYDRRFQDLPMKVAAIMNTGDVDALGAALAALPSHVADTALFRAAQFNQAFFIRPLVERCGANVNALDPRNNETALHTAANQRCVETVEELMSIGAAYDKKNKSGDTALMVAIQQLVWQNLPGRAEETIKVMLDKAGYVHSRGAWSEETPLTFAVAQGNMVVIKMLMDAGAPVNSPAKVPFYSREDDAPTGFWSPLHAAAKKGSEEMIVMLLAAGANPNGRDAKGCTPLHYATKHYYTKCTQLLLDAGADKGAYNSAGKFPQ